MLTLINTNLMKPPIAPVGLEYLASAAMQSGIQVDVLDLCLQADPQEALVRYLCSHCPGLIGLSFRNNDDCFWPSAQWFGPVLAEIVSTVRRHTDAPVVLGGVGLSIFAVPLLQYTGADWAIKGDGESAIVELYKALCGRGRLQKVPGLVYRDGDKIVCNPPAWPSGLCVRPDRTVLDNQRYLREGGQIGFETKRGCDRACTYCADPLAKGSILRLLDPREVADEVESLLGQGIGVLHTCDCEFNIPYDHAVAVCQEFIRRGLGEKVRWYAYLSVEPFDARLATLMRKAGCVGIDFTTDAACPAMLRVYGHTYGPEAITSAVRACRDKGIAVMTDLLLGGPGETVQTLSQTIDNIRLAGPDAVGAALGIRLYPGTVLELLLRSAGPLESNPGIRRRYDGPIDLARPTFYISPDLGPDPAGLVRSLVGPDPRFFLPATDVDLGRARDHNYNENMELAQAIQAGARGAYWHILLQLRTR